MTDQNSTGNPKYRPEDLTEKYGIKNAAYYRRLKFLGIEASKDGEGKVYLTDEQVEIMDALHEYIANNGKMEGFEFSLEGDDVSSEAVTQSTNKVDDNAEDAEEGGKLAVKGSSKLASKSQSPQPDSVIEQDIPQTQPNFSEGMDGIIRKAAEIKAQKLALPDLVVLQLAEQMELKDLPDDLQQKVSAVREAASPKMNPASVASDLLAQYRANR